jgi:hypothetical protein
MPNTFKTWIEEETFGRKYANAKAIADMIMTGHSDTVLNPAYNPKYREWIEKIREPLKIENKIGYSETNGIDPTIEMIGTGGVGSNQLYMLRDFKDFCETGNNERYGLSFFEYDTWDLSNLGRIPFRPTEYSKADTIMDLELGFHDKEETDFKEPLFIEGCHNKEVQAVPVGAMDLETAKMLYDARIPFIRMSHKDNSMIIELCPEPVSDLDMTEETYGIIDDSFLLPANHLASFWLADFMQGMNNDTTPAGKVYKAVKKYKDLYEYIRSKTITRVEDGDAILYGDMMYKCKYDSPDDIQVPEDIRMWTYIYAFGLLASKEGIEHIYKSIGREGEEPSFDKYPVELWDEFKHTVLLEIKEDDVKKFLSLSTGEEAQEYCRSISNEIK